MVCYRSKATLQKWPPHDVLVAFYKNYGYRIMVPISRQSRIFGRDGRNYLRDLSNVEQIYYLWKALGNAIANAKMRAAIYNPYMDTLGGGERYTMTVASVLKKHGWDVEVAWKNPKILEWLAVRLGINLSGVEIVPSISRGAGYDLVFWLSDGSIPLLLAKKNIIHFQTPFHNIGGKTLFNRLKLMRVDTVVCNSQFTKGFIDQEYGTKSVVLYPPAAVEQLKPLRKENIILFVGRFSELQQNKGQDILVRAFKAMCKGDLRGWRLILAGGSDVGGKDFVKGLKILSEGSRVDILENIPFSAIKKLYGRAKIFWSASGYGVNASENPQKVEHFGISVVEAMAAGCVPVVFNAGGHKEIINNTKDGFLWDSFDELEKITLDLISNERSREKIAEGARKKSKNFSQERFEKEILELLN